ncbi:helix-turn-helix domain-containing protein [Ferroglobus sp.]|uniref:helix-turn-helix domain-containing protein n=1 Tax=Ferroglobus sp. TaxID=2614230 RepID=UPI0025C5B726|nr:helix-turn-helix domain-containing protein [Ferroglobus sp.]
MDEIARKFAEHIAGDIVLSENPGNCIKKWRNIFEISQRELAEKLGITASVISDYESDRRKSPGVTFVKKIVNALIEIDKERGWRTLSKYRDLLGMKIDAIIDINEYSRSVSSAEIAEVLNGELIINFNRKANGYTVIDSIKAILTMTSYDFYRLFGLTSERALVFTQVTTGRSPMVAIKVGNLKPSVVVLQGLNSHKLDEIARKIAEIEKIDVILTEMPVSLIVDKLKRLGGE